MINCNHSYFEAKSGFAPSLFSSFKYISLLTGRQLFMVGVVILFILLRKTCAFANAPYLPPRCARHLPSETQSHCSLVALRIAPCFFTSQVRLHLPQAAAHLFAPSKGGVFIVLFNCHTKRLSFQREYENNV